MTDFQRLSSRLTLTAEAMEIEKNGLGFNNLIFMAVVLSELAKNTDSAFRSLIIEEPEAHLHPQLQRVLLKYLQEFQRVKVKSLYNCLLQAIPQILLVIQSWILLSA